ncbi:MAG: Gfo/Idh/MocA family oxidoreductase [Pirellulaceae bacterium]
MSTNSIQNSLSSRRRFVKTAAAIAAIGTTGASSQTVLGGVHHSVDDNIKVGLIGCGGRGSGAVANACRADSGVVITALADAFEDRIETCINGLKRNPDVGEEKLLVTPETCFSGLDCHEQLLKADVDVVLLAQPPYFRPESLKACIEAGKHVFCEKPVGVDVPGVLSVMDTCETAKGLNLNIVSGLCWRYDLGVRATLEKIHEGALGDIISIQENYLTGELWHRGNNPNWSQMEYQMRNWLYYSWLSGDIPLEQHIHSLDKALWVMHDEPPARAYGTGGRQKRVGEKWGNVYDHFATCYEWKNGVKTFSYCRQQNGCFNETEDWVYGTEGRAKILANEVQGKEGVWKYDGPKPSMYDVEHQYLFRAIREGVAINNGDYMAKSTLMAIMGRNACYTGKDITWDELLADETRLGPASVEFGDVDTMSVPIPGDGIA